MAVLVRVLHLLADFAIGLIGLVNESNFLRLLSLSLRFLLVLFTPPPSRLAFVILASNR